MKKETQATETINLSDKTIESVQIEVTFLQEIVDYLKTCPYEEVHRFMDILTKTPQGLE